MNIEKADIHVSYLNTSFVQIQAEDHIVYELRDYFSFQPPGYQFLPRYKYGGWNGYIYLMDYTGKLPYGLTYLVEKFAESNKYSITVDEKIYEKEPMDKESMTKWFAEHPVHDGANIIDPYWYQKDAVTHAIKERRACLSMPTSSGKSLVQCLIARWCLENYTGKVLIIVPTIALVTQMADDFTNYKLFPREAILGIKSGSVKNSNAPIYVSTWQSAAKMPPEWFQQFMCVMVDEAHNSTGASIAKIVNDMDQCIFKFGLSGSFKEGKANMLQYVGAFGKIYKPVDTNTLMKEGQVTNLKINTLFLRYTEEEVKKMKGKEYQEEIDFVIGHKRRNAWICKLALKLARDKKENVFLMFTRRKHGKMLYEALKQVYDNVVYISGETDIDERDEMKKIAEASDGLIVVGSNGVLSTGISVKKLHHIIFSHPTKSVVTVKQVIGRVLRKHSSKDIATAWDICDDLATLSKSKTAKSKYSKLNYGMKHCAERIRIYNEEKFDYSLKRIEI